MKRIILSIVGVCACIAFSALSVTGAAADGKSLTEERCSSCHGLGKVFKKTGAYSEEKWAKVVARMVKKGARLDDEEQQAVTAYLASLGE